jgi:hypothetical protein
MDILLGACTPSRKNNGCGAKAVPAGIDAKLRIFRVDGFEELK